MLPANALRNRCAPHDCLIAFVCLGLQRLHNEAQVIAFDFKVKTVPQIVLRLLEKGSDSVL